VQTTESQVTTRDHGAKGQLTNGSRRRRSRAKAARVPAMEMLVRTLAVVALKRVAARTEELFAVTGVAQQRARQELNSRPLD
jgi:hypothetical protein